MNKETADILLIILIVWITFLSYFFFRLFRPREGSLMDRIAVALCETIPDRLMRK
jgi:hypothetical protein